MAAARLVVPVEGWPSPGPFLLEAATKTHSSTWTVIGGMMVQIHARLSGIEPPRTTIDVDLLLDLMTRHTSVQTSSTSYGPQGPEMSEAQTRIVGTKE